MKVFGYIRVSGASQVEGDGPERQAEKIHSFCAANGLTRVEDYFEAGVSGTVECEDRKQFANLLCACNQQNADGIVIERLDRLARELRVQEIILHELRRRGLKLFCADQGVLVDVASDDVDPTRVLMRQIIGAVAQWEKSALVLKMKAAKDRIRAETGRCEGPKPYGQNDDELRVIAEIRGALSFGRTCREIAVTLNALGKKTRQGKDWTLDSVQRVAVSSKNVILPKDL